MDNKDNNTENNTIEKNLEDNIFNLNNNTDEILDNQNLISSDIENQITNNNIENNNNKSNDLNKKLNLLNEMKVLTNNIKKDNISFIINKLFQIIINNIPYKLLYINNLHINNTSNLLDIYIHIMECFKNNNDFNINITYQEEINLNKKNISIILFGSIPVYDEILQQITFYEDFNSINNYLKSLNKTIDKDTLEIYNKLEKLCELKKKNSLNGN